MALRSLLKKSLVAPVSGSADPHLKSGPGDLEILRRFVPPKYGRCQLRAPNPPRKPENSALSGALVDVLQQSNANQVGEHT